MCIAVLQCSTCTFYCGLREESLIENDEIKELKKMYAIVYPLCFVCLSDGKKPFCRRPNNVAKKRKTSKFPILWCIMM